MTPEQHDMRMDRERRRAIRAAETAGAAAHLARTCSDTAARGALEPWVAAEITALATRAGDAWMQSEEAARTSLAAAVLADVEAAARRARSFALEANAAASRSLQLTSPKERGNHEQLPPIA